MEIIFYWLPILIVIGSYFALRDMGKDAKRLDTVSRQSVSLYLIIFCSVVLSIYLGVDLAISLPQTQSIKEFPYIMWSNLNTGMLIEILSERFPFGEFMTVMMSCICFAYIMTSFAYYNNAGLKDYKIISSYIESSWYYESWTERCTRIVSSTSNGKTTYRTETYYVNHPPYWEAILGNNKVLSIRSKDYDRYVSLFDNQKKKSLSRLSQSSFGDGNAYYTLWPKTDETMVPATYKVDYFNYVTASDDTTLISNGDELKYKNYLIEYPSIIYSEYGGIDVDRVLIPNVQFDESIAQDIDIRLSKYLALKCKEKDINILVYITNQSLSFWDALHEKWEGARFNDVIVVVGIDENTRKINWSKTMSWDNIPLSNSLDNDLMRLTYFYSSPDICETIIHNVDQYYVIPNVDKYEYLASDVRLPWYSVVGNSLLVGLVCSILIAYFYHFGYAEVWYPFKVLLTALWNWIISLLNK